jgi:hypothetical protein
MELTEWQQKQVMEMSKENPNVCTCEAHEIGNCKAGTPLSESNKRFAYNQYPIKWLRVNVFTKYQLFSKLDI